MSHTILRVEDPDRAIDDTHRIPAVPSATPPRGVDLGRLLTGATLTPPQATYVAARVLAALAELHAAGSAHGRVGEATVTVGVDGEPHLDEPVGAGWDGVDSAAVRESDLAATRTLLFRLARNADRPAARHSPAGNQLLLELDRRAGASLDDAGEAAAALTSRLARTAGPDAPESQVRRELGALALALAPAPPHDAGAAPDAGRRGSPPSADQDAGSLLSQGELTRRRRRRGLLVAVAVLVVALVAGVLARGPLVSLGDRLLHRHPAAAATSGSATPAHHRSTGADHPAVARSLRGLAPSAAGAVRGVSVHHAATCRPGARCTVRIAATVRSGSSRHRLHWKLVAADRCGGPRHRLARGVITVPAGAARGHVTRTVRLPRGASVGMVALVTAPVRVASPPVSVGRPVPHC